MRWKSKNIIFIILICLFLLVGTLFILCDSDINNDDIARPAIISSNQIKQSADIHCPAHYLLILSVDGGGIRGVVPLVLLDKITDEANAEPSSLFQIMSGISTGAIIVSALGLHQEGAANKVKYPVHKLLGIYEEDASRMLSASFWHKLGTVWGIAGPVLEARNKNNMIARYTGNATLYDLNRPIILFGLDTTQKRIISFCNQPYCNKKLSRYPLKKILAGITAIPMFFQPVAFYDENGKAKSLISDVGMIANNPSYMTYKIAQSMCPRTSHYILVSLGTGHIPAMDIADVKPRSGFMHWIPYMLASTGELNSEITSDYLLNIMHATLHHAPAGTPQLMYLRFNPTLTKEDINPLNTSPSNIKKLINLASQDADSNRAVFRCLGMVSKYDRMSQACSNVFSRYIALETKEHIQRGLPRFVVRK